MMRFKRQESRLWNNDATLEMGAEGEDTDSKNMNKDVDVEGPLEFQDIEYTEW